MKDALDASAGSNAARPARVGWRIEGVAGDVGVGSSSVKTEDEAD